MWRNRQELAVDTTFNFVMNHGALGDMISSLPAVIHGRRSHNDILKMKVHVMPHQVALVEHLLKPYGEFEVCDIAAFPLKRSQREDWTGGPIACNHMQQNTHTRNRVHMVDFAFNCLLDAAPNNMQERSYPQAALGPRVIDEPYVVFPLGATSENKLFKASVFVPVMEWCIAQGYKVVVTGTKMSFVHKQIGEFVSAKPIEIIDEKDKIPPALAAQLIDKMEKTTLLELRDLLGHAMAVVAIDGGTVHLAGTTDTNIIYSLTTAHPRHRYIARFGDPHYKIRYVVPRKLECSFCQSNSNLIFWHDFSTCFYGDNKCVDALHPEDFTNGLKELGL